MSRLAIRGHCMSKSKECVCVLLGLHRIFVLMRSNIRNPNNNVILEKINNQMSDGIRNKVFDFELFKNSLLEIVKNDAEYNDFLMQALNIDCENQNTDNLDEIFKYLPVLSDMISEIMECINKEKYEIAFDLIDAVHCLPESLIEKSNWDSQSYWNHYVKPYREKWNNEFLNNREAELFNK